MNHIYKVIWNKAKQCYTVFSEIAKSHKNSSNGGSINVKSHSDCKFN